MPRPPDAAATLAVRRGPPWLLTIFDFLERQLSLATNVEDRISLLRAYTRAILAMLTLSLTAVAAAVWALSNAHLPSLIVLAAGGMVAGLGASIRRLRHHVQRTASSFIDSDREPAHPWLSTVDSREDNVDDVSV